VKNAISGRADVFNDLGVGTTADDPLALKSASPPYRIVNDCAPSRDRRIREFLSRLRRLAQ
jgi:hypothetical protein